MARLRPATRRTLVCLDNAATHLRLARDYLIEAATPKTLAALDRTLSSLEGAVRHAHRRLDATSGMEVRHDMHGFYVCTTEEAEHEDDGNPSVGFDGRKHWDKEGDAWREVAARLEETNAS